MQIDRFKSTVKKLLEPEKAYNLQLETRKNIQDWEQGTAKIKKNFYDLIVGDAFVALKYKSEKVFFKELCDVSSLHRSTLYDYKNAASIEVELMIDHGTISVSALLELRANTTEESRKEIWPMVKNYCLYKEKNPTKGIISKVKKNHYSKSPEGLAERKRLSETYDPDQDGPSYAEPSNNDDKTRQMTAERALKRINKYTSKQLQILSNRIFPKGMVGKDIFRILHESTDEELNKFKEELKAYLNKTDNTVGNEYTDEELEMFSAELQAYFEISNNTVGHEYTDEELEMFSAEFQAYFEINDD